MSNNLNLDQVSPTQTSKELTINTALGQLDAAITDVVTIDASGGALSVSGSVYQRHYQFKFTGAPADHTAITLPLVKRSALIINASSFSLDLTVGTTVVTVLAGKHHFISTDGTANGLFAVEGTAVGPQGPNPLLPIQAWVTSTGFTQSTATVGASFVFFGGSAYECLITHTSGTFATDLAAGKWGIVANGPPAPFVLPIVAWVTATAFVSGPPASLATQGGSTYVCLVAHTSGTFATDLAAGKWLLLAQRGNDGTPVNFSALNDVTITTIADKQFLRWDAGTSKWVNFTFGNVNTQTASYTLTLADDDGYVRMNVGSANNCTVPPNSSVAFPIGSTIEVSQVGAGATTIVAGAGVTINTVAAVSLTLGTQFLFGALRKVATNVWDWEEGASGVVTTTALAGLTDVVLATPTNNQVLTYETSSGKWKNKALPAIPAVLDDLTDVALGTPTTGDVLKFDGTNWVNGTVSGGGGGSSGSNESAWTKPVASDYTMAGSSYGSPAVADLATTPGGIKYRATGAGTNTNTISGAMRTITTPAATWTLITRMRRNYFYLAFMGSGLVIRESATGKALLFGWSVLNVFGLDVFTGDAAYSSTTNLTTDQPLDIWMKVHYDSVTTKFTFYISTDGTNWCTLFLSNVVTTYFTTNANQVGIGGDPNNSGVALHELEVQCFSWTLTQP